MPAKLKLPPWKKYKGASIDAHTINGPLAVAQGYNLRDREPTGYWRVYHVKIGLPFGPHYATSRLAVQAMEKALSWGFAVWNREADAFRGDKKLKKRMEKELGENWEIIHE